MKVFGKELRFGDPKAVDIVIFDDCNSLYVRKALNPIYQIEIFKMRPYEIWIGPRILVNMFRCLVQLSLSEAARYSRGFIFGILRQLRLVYFESCLVSMKPKAVITFIDNDDNFHWLSRKCKKFPFVAIQNGARLRYASAEVSGYYLQHLFSWGAHEAKLFADMGYQVEKYHPVGSLLASLTFEHIESEESDTLDLLIVSTWRGNIGFPPDVVDTMRSMKIMDQLLARYISARAIKAAIILRAERNSEHWAMNGIGTEYDYYREIYGESVEIIEADFKARTIYPTMQRSRLIVSCLSSALIEAYGIGKRVLYCNFTGTNIYHCDIDSRIVTDIDDSENFFSRLDVLLAQPIDEYRRLHADSMREVMSFPVGCATHKAIADSVDILIGDFDVTAN